MLFPACQFSETNLPKLPPLPKDAPLPKPPSTPTNTLSNVPLRDKLFPTRKLALSPVEINQEVHNAIEKEECFPKHIPIKQSIGKTMLPRTFALTHPAATLITDWGLNGCPVDCGENWSHVHILAALRRGPHKSAKSKEAIAALREETDEKVRSGYARIVKWKDIKHCIPPKLKLSPVAMVPHKSQKFRTILDLSFQLRHKGKLLPSVNSNTTKLAPAEAMIQLGLCMKRIVATLADNINPSQPFVFAKVDIKDGFWRLRVSNEDAWNFCYTMPSQTTTDNIDETEIIVPNSLQMGWCESPPLFCAVTETARDVIDDLLRQTTLPSHKYEHQMMDNAQTGLRLQAAIQTTNLLEVFVDDFIGMTNNTSTSHLQTFSKAILHGIYWRRSNLTKENAAGRWHMAHHQRNSGVDH